MSEADEMFEELGYWLESENKIHCIYGNDDYDVIKFNKEAKEFYKGDEHGELLYITLSELQAINKKVEEWGWI